MRYEILRSLDEWATLREPWAELLSASREDQVFITWEWLDSWLRVQRTVTDLFVICIRGPAGELVGAAPFYRADYRFCDLVRYRTLHMIGDLDSGAEYQTWLARSPGEDRVFRTIAQALRDLRAEWDLLWMPRLGSWNPGHTSVLHALEFARLGHRSRPKNFSTVSLPCEYEAYLASMSPNRRQQVRRATKKILSRPRIEVRKVTGQHELGQAMESLFRLHGKRWQSVGQNGVFARNPKEREFYEHFLPRALEQGWLAMYSLLDDGDPKAVQIGYVYKGVFLQLQEGFDPDYEPQAGNALRACVIQDCIRNGIREYDFLGGHSEHKRRWMAVERTGVDLLAYVRRPRNLPSMLGVWPTGAYLRPARSPARRVGKPSLKPGLATQER